MDSPELLIRRPGEKISEVTRAWEGETVACVACGPSLQARQLEAVRAAGVKTAVVNDAYLAAPWAQLLYAADAVWWAWHREGLDKTWPWATHSKQDVRQAMAAFAGQKCTIEHPGNAALDATVHRLKNDSDASGNPAGLADKPNAIRTGRNSGYQLLNLIVHTRPRRIVLIGYDMTTHGSRTHAHNGHPRPTSGNIYRDFAGYFDTLPPLLEPLGVEIVNCTPGSAIRSFAQMPLEQALA